MMVVAIFVGVWLVMALAPETPIARALQTWVVDRPAAWLARIGRRQIVLMLAVVAAIGVACWLGGDAIRASAMVAPDVFAWAVTFDVATFADVALAVALASSTLRLRGLVARLRVAIRRPAAHHRRVRRGPRPLRPAPANDDEDRRAVVAA